MIWFSFILFFIKLYLQLTRVNFPWLRTRLQENFQEQIIIPSSTDKSNVVALIDTALKIVRYLYWEILMILTRWEIHATHFVMYFWVFVKLNYWRKMERYNTRELPFVITTYFINVFWKKNVSFDYIQIYRLS